MLLGVAERLRGRGFRDLQCINLGGGLGIDYERHVRRFLLSSTRALTARSRKRGFV